MNEKILSDQEQEFRQVFIRTKGDMAKCNRYFTDITIWRKFTLWVAINQPHLPYAPKY